VSRKQPKCVLIKLPQADFNKGVSRLAILTVMFVPESKHHKKKINSKLGVHVYVFLTSILDGKSSQLQATAALPLSKELRILTVSLYCWLPASRIHGIMSRKNAALTCNLCVPNVIRNLVLIKEKFHLFTSMPKTVHRNI
jgi:hypothetical protein